MYHINSRRLGWAMFIGCIYVMYVYIGYVYMNVRQILYVWALQAAAKSFKFIRYSLDTSRDVCVHRILVYEWERYETYHINSRRLGWAMFIGCTVGMGNVHRMYICDVCVHRIWVYEWEIYETYHINSRRLGQAMFMGCLS